MKLRGPYFTKKEFITVELNRMFDAIHKWPGKMPKKVTFLVVVVVVVQLFLIYTYRFVLWYPVCFYFT